MGNSDSNGNNPSNTSATTEKTRQIGEGGQGAVYVKRLADGKQVAMKILSENSLSDNRGILLCKNKVKHEKILKCKGIQPIVSQAEKVKFDAENEEKVKIFYDYYPKGDATKNLVDNKNTKQEDRNKFQSDLVEAVSELHQKKIVHMDIKPRNVFCGKNCYVLGDLDSCTETKDPDRSCITMQYCAPELCELHESLIDREKADSYSLRMTLAEVSLGSQATKL